MSRKRSKDPLEKTYDEIEFKRILEAIQVLGLDSPEGSRHIYNDEILVLKTCSPWKKNKYVDHNIPDDNQFKLEQAEDVFPVLCFCYPQYLGVHEALLDNRKDLLDWDVAGSSHRILLEFCMMVKIDMNVEEKELNIAYYKCLTPREENEKSSS